MLSRMKHLAFEMKKFVDANKQQLVNMSARKMWDRFWKNENRAHSFIADRFGDDRNVCETTLALFQPLSNLVPCLNFSYTSMPPGSIEEERIFSNVRWVHGTYSWNTQTQIQRNFGNFGEDGFFEIVLKK